MANSPGFYKAKPMASVICVCLLLTLFLCGCNILHDLSDSINNLFDKGPSQQEDDNTDDVDITLPDISASQNDPPPSAAEDIPQIYGTVNADVLNMRDAPSLEGAIISKLGEGTQLEIVEDHGEWLYILTGGQYGYVFAEYVTISTDASPQASIKDSNGLVWSVEPTLEYDNIFYCNHIDSSYFASTSLVIDPQTGYSTLPSIDSKTGLIDDISDHNFGHGGGGMSWIYNTDKNTFGCISYDVDGSIEMYPMNEFAARFSSNINTLNHVKRFDLDITGTTSFPAGDPSSPLDDSFWTAFSNSRYAIALGNKLLTDFIYDEVDGDGIGYRHYMTNVAVRADDKWGFLDNTGAIAVPFIFDHAIKIDEATSFVKYNGYYGILNVAETMRR